MTATLAPSIDLADLPAPIARPRLDWVDNLRTAMIVLVVNMHACVTYSFVGSWYYNSPPEPSIPEKIPFLFWQGHLQSFFMGLLFFLGGYYADRSLSRRGARAFVVERLRRLGIPTLIYMLAIHPLIVLGLHPGYPRSGTPLKDYFHAILSGSFLGDSGPMWFAFALLLFSLLFAAFGSRQPKPESRTIRLQGGFILGLGASLAVATFLVRTVQPMGTSILNFQFCYFSQYVAAFVLGIWVSRRDSLSAVAASPIAKRAGIAALILGPIALAIVAIASMPIPTHGAPPFNGGWNLSALGLATWDQMTGVGLALGFMAWFAKRANSKTRWSAWLSERSFAVYLLHAPILVALALVVQPYRTNPYVMSIGLTLAGLAVSFAAADLAKRVPLLKSVL